MTITTELAQELRERYTPKPAPKCHICGSKMTIQRAGGGSLTYGCDGRVDTGEDGYQFAEGRDFADDHYAQSRVTIAARGDDGVIALLDALEHYKSREERVTKLVLNNQLSWEQLAAQLETKDKQIAELTHQLSDSEEHVSALELSQLDNDEWSEISAQKDNRIAELERDVTKLIEERDNAEEALADMFEAATGERPEWSSAFGYDDAVEVVGEKTEEWKDRLHTIDMSNSVLKAKLEARTEQQPMGSTVIEAATALIRRYISNPGTDSEFISCWTPSKSSIGTGGVWDEWKALESALNTATPAPAAVTVKLRPSVCSGGHDYRSYVINVLTAAGIKIAEGE